MTNNTACRTLVTHSCQSISNRRRWWHNTQIHTYVHSYVHRVYTKRTASGKGVKCRRSTKSNKGILLNGKHIFFHLIFLDSISFRCLFPLLLLFLPILYIVLLIFIFMHSKRHWRSAENHWTNQSNPFERWHKNDFRTKLRYNSP